MKDVKKLIALLLVIAMLFTLAACGGNNSKIQQPEEEKGTATPKDDEKAGEDSSVSFIQKEEESEGIMLGSVEEYTYQNEWLGLACALDSEWYLYSEEEILQQNQMMVENYEEIADVLQSKNTYIDMIVQRLDGACNMNVVVENMGLVYGNIITEDMYLDISIQNVVPSYEAMGMTLTSSEKLTVDFIGAERPACRLTVNNGNGELYQLMIPIKVDQHMACICITTFNTDFTEDLLNYFYKI